MRKRVVIKLGSSLILDANQLNRRLLKDLAGQVRLLQQNRWDVLVVCSGAVAYGQILVGKVKDDLKRQVAAAVGQAFLIASLVDIFSQEEVTVGLLLLGKSEFQDVMQRDQIRKLLISMIDDRLVPIINENDAVSLNCFGGNDYLSAEIVQIVDSRCLIILTDVDGLIGRGEVVSQVRQVNNAVRKLVWKDSSKNGIGGMKTKLDVAELLTKQGRQVIVACGFKKNALLRILIDGENLGTRFLSKKS